MALTDKLKAIADAIRAKTGKTETFTLDQMAAEIGGIAAAGGAVYEIGTFVGDGTGALNIPVTTKKNNIVIKANGGVDISSIVHYSRLETDPTGVLIPKGSNSAISYDVTFGESSIEKEKFGNFVFNEGTEYAWTAWRSDNT